MMLSLKNQRACFVVLTTILLLGSFARAQEISAEAAAEADNEAVRRLEQSMLFTKTLDEADRLLAAKSIEPARTRYQQVFAQTDKVGPMAPLNARAAKGLGVITALQARQAMDRNDLVAARQLWEQALVYDPDNAGFRGVYEQVREKTKDPAELFPNNTAVNRELQDKVNQIQRYIFEGDSFSQTGQYERAVARYKAVLLIDPYNDQARKRIQKTEQIIEQVSAIRMKQRKESAMSMVERQWASRPQAAVDQKMDMEVMDASSSNIANLYDKLNNIIIPECRFTDADLADVLNFLQEQSRVLDPAGVGVNIVFKGEPTSVDGGAGSPQMMRSLTLDLKDLSLIKILDFIKSLSSYQYKVEEHAVIVFPDTETNEIMLVRTFSVPPNFFQTQVKVDDTTVGVLGTKTVTMVTADVKSELAQKGVKFTAGASAAYLPKTARLVVRNTLDQLNLISQLLDREANVSTQVEISTKFIEFSEDKLKDLSFNLRTSLSMRFAQLPNSTAPFAAETGGNLQTITASNKAAPLNFNNYFPNPAAAAGDLGVGTSLRNANSLLTNPLDSLLGLSLNRSPNMISVTAIIDGTGAQALITALESTMGSDLMSEPKITLFNGQESKIRIVRELLYPTQWDAPKVPTVSGGGGNNNVVTAVTVVPSVPSNFKVKDIGVTLKVKANATPDRRIDLKIAPEVVEFQGFINYGGDATTLGLGSSSIVRIVEGVALTPVFSTRSIDTQVQVVDGQTVVMGGFIRSDNQDIEDKVPLLGDLPLLGRVFRSKSSQVVKRNLIIFLTARMIRPDGRYEYMTEGERELIEVTSIPTTEAGR